MTLPSGIDISKLKKYLQEFRNRITNPISSKENGEKTPNMYNQSIVGIKTIIMDLEGNNIVIKFRLVDGTSQIRYSDTVSVEKIEETTCSILYYQFDESDNEIQTIELFLNKEEALNINWNFCLTRGLTNMKFLTNMDILMSGGTVQITLRNDKVKKIGKQPYDTHR